MKSVVVYESLWGHTEAIARALAEGLGSGATAMSTTEATPGAIAGADLIVAGAPVHMMHLPTPSTREKARERGERPGATAPDLSQVSMIDWLANLPTSRGACAGFDTRIESQRGGASGSRIVRGLKRRGYRALVKPARFVVDRVEDNPGSNVRLREGELDRARDWGAALARAVVT